MPPDRQQRSAHRRLLAQLRNARVEAPARVIADVIEHLLGRPRRAIDPVRQQRIEHVRHHTTIAGSEDARQKLDRLLGEVSSISSLSDLRSLEGMAARAYWQAWQSVSVRWVTSDLKRIPKHWTSFGSRTSPLTNATSPRKAVNPPNAILNYLYALLEAEARIASLAVGLDPLLGVLHTDQRNRDSLACDLMEPIRPAVDAQVLAILREHRFTRKDVFELIDGQCRPMPALADHLAGTTARWARAVLPIAQDVADRLRTLEVPLAPRRPDGHGVRKGRRSRRPVVREYRPRLSA